VKDAVFWDVAPCGFIIVRRLGGTCRLNLQGRRNNAGEEKSRWWLPDSLLVTLSPLRMEATRSSETSVYNKPTQHHCILHSHRREDLKSYILQEYSHLSLHRPSYPPYPMDTDVLASGSEVRIRSFVVIFLDSLRWLKEFICEMYPLSAFHWSD
jgi:hypothetical protein